ncbi:MAG: Ger(x)C family spore germination protein, partial [Clostridia bacterium]|nr:Ger(x)C family spore germination protein [Clostridia bacterium]
RPGYQVTFISTKPSPAGTQVGTTQEGDSLKHAQQWIAASYGNSIEEAMMKFTVRSPRYAYLEHNRIIVFGVELSKQGTSELVDYLLRKRELRLRNYIVVADKDSMHVLSAMPEFESTFAQEIVSIIERGSYDSNYLSYTLLNNFAGEMVTSGQDPWAPVLSVIKADERKTEKPKIAPIINRAAIFREDRLAGILDNDETQAFYIMKNLSHTGSVKSWTNEGKVLQMTYNEAKVKRRLVKKEDKASVHYEVNIKGLLHETNEKKELTTQKLDEYETAFEEEVKKNIYRMIDSCRNKGSDVLGIGRFIHSRDKKLWDSYKSDWYRYYSEIPINVDVKVDIMGNENTIKIISPNKEG